MPQNRYRVEGKGTLAIGEEEKPFKKGDLVFCNGEIPIGPKKHRPRKVYGSGHPRFKTAVSKAG